MIINILDGPTFINAQFPIINNICVTYILPLELFNLLHADIMGVHILPDQLILRA